MSVYVEREESDLPCLLLHFHKTPHFVAVWWWSEVRRDWKCRKNTFYHHTDHAPSNWPRQPTRRRSWKNWDNSQIWPDLGPYLMARRLHQSARRPDLFLFWWPWWCWWSWWSWWSWWCWWCWCCWCCWCCWLFMLHQCQFWILYLGYNSNNPTTDWRLWYGYWLACYRYLCVYQLGLTVSANVNISRETMLRLISSLHEIAGTSWGISINNNTQLLTLLLGFSSILALYYQSTIFIYQSGPLSLVLLQRGSALIDRKCC